MYRLVLYCLGAIFFVALILSFLNLLPFSPAALLFSITLLGIVGWLTNTIFAEIYHSPTNLESVYISALILALILPPAKDLNSLFLLFWAAVLTMASKFILAIHKKHIFNPVVVAMCITAITGVGSANWWVGQKLLLPIAVITSFLIIRKINKLGMILGFLITSATTIVVLNLLKGFGVQATLTKVFFDTPWIFFAGVMLTEPLTTPPGKLWRLVYGVLVGFLFSPQLHLGQFNTTPESALLIGNVMSYLVSPKNKWLLTLVEKIQIGPQMWDYVFKADTPIKFKPGHYLELTLAQKRPDSRGSRRYLTIASSPTENNIRFGIKFYEPGSSFKQQLKLLQPGEQLLAGQLSGDFLLPKDKKQKLAFIAGGIGITPFRSMVKYLADNNEKRDIVLIYSNKSEDEIIYKDVFENNVRTIYINTQIQGRLTTEQIEQYIPDFAQRKFYLSGPHSMVSAFEKNVAKLGLGSESIITDFFPGFA